MAIGDQEDMQARLYAALPTGWFPALSMAPKLGAVLAGFGYGFSRIYGLLTFARAQTRIATASGIWLDGIAKDFFGGALMRSPGQTDAALRQKIVAQVVRQKGTRAGLIAALTTLTGRAPLIFEPSRPSDTGGYNVGGIGYGAAGGYGSLAIPFQCFVIAYRPTIEGQVSGGGYGSGIGYGVGGGQYIDAAAISGGVTDSDIYATVAATIQAGTIAWTKILA